MKKCVICLMLLIAFYNTNAQNYKVDTIIIKYPVHELSDSTRIKIQKTIKDAYYKTNEFLKKSEGLEAETKKLIKDLKEEKSLIDTLVNNMIKFIIR